MGDYAYAENVHRVMYNKNTAIFQQTLTHKRTHTHAHTHTHTHKHTLV